MNHPIPAGDYVAHFDPELPHHRAWLLAVLEQLVAHEPQALEEGGTLRRLWTAHQAAAGAGPAPVADIPAAVTVALPLVKEFEGCRLESYPDSESGGEPWTIGWGSTTYGNGARVQKSDRISQELAVGEALSEGVTLLSGRLVRDWRSLRDCIPVYKALTTNQQAALLSFTYNCGPRWFGAKGFDTLTKALRSGALETVPAALMLYVNPGGPKEAGLRRRRKSEGRSGAHHPIGGAPGPPIRGIATTQPGETRSVTPTRWWGCPGFSSAIRSSLPSAIAPVFRRAAPCSWRPSSPARSRAPMAPTSTRLRALAHYGVTTRLVQSADFQLIEQKIARGIPVPCGYIHRGPVDRPTGSGHWLIVVGHTPTQVVVNDPWGEPDLIGCTTLNPNGMGLRFSRLNYRCAGLRLRQALDGGADRWRCLPLRPQQGLGGGSRRHPLRRALRGAFSAAAVAGGGSVAPTA